MTRTSGWQETSLFFPYRSIAVYLPRNYTTALDALIQVVIWPKVHARRKNKDFYFYLDSINTLNYLSWYPQIWWYIHNQRNFSKIFLKQESLISSYLFIQYFCSLNRYSANFFESKSGKANKYYFKMRDNYNIARL